MYICTPCLNQRFTNQESVRLSSGKCEICMKWAGCNDIPSILLKQKENISVITGQPIVKPEPVKNKTVRVTVELNNSFLKLLRANIQLSKAREKVENGQADPCTILGVLIFGEAAGELEDKLDAILPPERRDEVQLVHNERRIFVNGEAYDKAKHG